MSGAVPGKPAHPPKGEEIVISGLSGVYPKSRNVRQFFQNLLDKADLVSDDNQRWEVNEGDVPKRLGTIEGLEKFDTGFFGIHPRQTNTMDCLGRILLEKTAEAVLDAGVNLEELRGTKTGVYVGLTHTETERVWLYQKLESRNFCVTGCFRSLFANRISYWLKLNGPSYCLDTGCSSSLVALESAYNAIRKGECDAAIVGSGNVCLAPNTVAQYKSDGMCKTFDADADGYVRSESVCVVLLQKAKNSRRVYAKVVHAKSNSDGYKEEGIVHPSSTSQQQLFEEVCNEANIKLSEVTYIEAHGTGTKVGDLQEVHSINQAYCNGRTTPLLIGSVKTNIGHCEPASGLCSVSKVLLAMENAVIPPNLHYKTLRPELVPIKEGRLVVVKEKTSILNDNVLVGINSFGFGGVNSHVLLQSNPKRKVNDDKRKDDIPRLVCVSGREEASILSILDDIKSRPLDAEFVGLLHNAFKCSTPSERYRGFAIVSKSGELCRKLRRYYGKPKLCFLFSDASRSSTLPPEWFQLPVFRTTFANITDILKLRNINSLEAFGKLPVKDGIYRRVMLGFSFQIVLLHILKEIGIAPDYVRGVSHGRLIAAYCNNILTLEQTVLCLHFLAQGVQTYDDNLNNIALPDSSHLYVEEAQNKIGENLLKNISRMFPENGTRDLLKNIRLHLFEELSDDPFMEPLPETTMVLQFGESKHLLATKSYKLDKDITSFFTSLGNIYLEGIDIDIKNLYPQVEYPVSKGTPPISSLIKWNHGHNWFVAFSKPKLDWSCSYRFSVDEKQWNFLLGHVVDGRTLFPLSGCLYFVWKTLSSALNKRLEETPVVFENLRCLRAMIVSQNSYNQLDVMIQKKSGKFNVIEDGTVFLAGSVRVPTSVSEEMTDFQYPEKCLNNCAFLLEDDIYKEFGLRGYLFRNSFRTLKMCDSSFKNFVIQWDGNFICFIDGMLQAQLPMTTRHKLIVPTIIEKVVIDPMKHFKTIEECGKKIPVSVLEETKIVRLSELFSVIYRSSGIEIKGISTRIIQRSIEKVKPTLQKEIFVPNEAAISLQESIRVNMQIVLENYGETTIKVFEIIDEESVDGLKTLSDIIIDALSSEPEVTPEITVFTNQTLEIPTVTVQTGSLPKGIGDVVVATNILSRPSLLQQIYDATEMGGFIISTETNGGGAVKQPGLETITVHYTEAGMLILLRKSNSGPKPVIIEVTDKTSSFNWLSRLQKVIVCDKPSIVYAQNQPLSGILGLTKSLRKEPKGKNVVCVFIADKAPTFDKNLPFYKEQLQKGLAINVFKDGKWGTYRYLPLEKKPTVMRQHCQAVVGTKGDPSSIRWAEGMLTSDSEVEIGQALIHVYYTGIISADVTIASGKFGMALDVPGYEFSGKDSSGRRVMGLVPNSALASLVVAEKRCLVEVPDKWTMEDAATVPFAYITALYALCVKGEIAQAQTILIHAAAGGVGQAAVNIALHFNCEIFVSVGNEEKIRFIREHFPQIALGHIGNCRDTTFEQTILRATKGRGVDLVLNSLSDEMLQTSLRCLATGGKFLHIRRFDILNDKNLNLELMRRAASFHGITLEHFFDHEDIKFTLMECFKSGVEKGIVKPIERIVYAAEEVQEAFRSMAKEKHIGKAVVKIRSEEVERNCLPAPKFFETIPRFFCDPSGVYIITGQLEGFGMELADWLVLKGARYLVLSSTCATENGYKAFRIRTWKSLGVSVHISTANITKQKGCLELMQEASSFGSIKGIFHLALDLGDTIIENHTAENFEPIALEYLDVLSRQHCPDIKVFVAFSSLDLRRGNTDKMYRSIYSSVIDRICEQRKLDGLPALAVHWGPIGEIDVVAESRATGGVLQQRISSCLLVLETFLTQNEPVVSSMILDTKKDSIKIADNVVEFVANIMGIRDLRTISDQSTLSELGLDSLMAVEMRKSLETKFRMVLTVKDLRSFTFERLRNLNEDNRLA